MSSPAPRPTTSAPAEADPLVVAREALRAASVLIDAAIATKAKTKQATDADEEYLTVPEIARKLRRSETFARRLCRTGAIRSLRDGHGYRATRSAFAAYIRRRTA